MKPAPRAPGIWYDGDLALKVAEMGIEGFTKGCLKRCPNIKHLRWPPSSTIGVDIYNIYIYTYIYTCIYYIICIYNMSTSKTMIFHRFRRPSQSDSGTCQFIHSLENEVQLTAQVKNLD